MPDPNPKPNTVTIRVSGLDFELDAEVHQSEEIPPEELKAHLERLRKMREQRRAWQREANPTSATERPADDKPAA